MAWALSFLRGRAGCRVRAAGTPPYHSAFTSIHRRTHVRIYMLYVHVVDNDEDDDVATSP